MNTWAHARQQQEQEQEQGYQNMCNALLKQIEYYFSDDNLVRDNFLKSRMDGDGWVSVDVISKFPRVKQWTDDKRLILKALQPSTVVEVQGNKIRRRGDWMVWISSNGSSSSKSPTPHEQVSMKNLRLDGDSKAEPEAAAADIHLNNVSINAHEEMNIGTTQRVEAEALG
ncbi:la-related protein 1C-like protein [Cinnamomum micranthum f. kanehirae]|uniref:La-related protein 1C-like protein n=1 Tax=Cinnamomum micranthum f. kanehirae TaxID=337451 RepID=A0A3S3P3X2_9MAGN|nr:la-related protein 1C-like protein [Cinnamomum micranthum f. kanehirae]